MNSMPPWASKVRGDDKIRYIAIKILSGLRLDKDDKPTVRRHVLPSRDVRPHTTGAYEPERLKREVEASLRAVVPGCKIAVECRYPDLANPHYYTFTITTIVSEEAPRNESTGSKIVGAALVRR